MHWIKYLARMKKKRKVFTWFRSLRDEWDVFCQENKLSMMIEPRLEWNLFCTKHNIDPKCIDDRARLWFEWCSEMGSKFCYRKDVFYVYYRKYLPSSKTEIVYSRSSSPETERRQSM